MDFFGRLTTFFYVFKEGHRECAVRIFPKQIIHPRVFARAGFIYQGDADCVRCLDCRLRLYEWEVGDDPMALHKQYRPTCPFVITNL